MQVCPFYNVSHSVIDHAGGVQNPIPGKIAILRQSPHLDGPIPTLTEQKQLSAKQKLTLGIAHSLCGLPQQRAECMPNNMQGCHSSMGGMKPASAGLVYRVFAMQEITQDCSARKFTAVTILISLSSGPILSLHLQHLCMGEHNSGIQVKKLV